MVEILKSWEVYRYLSPVQVQVHYLPSERLQEVSGVRAAPGSGEGTHDHQEGESGDKKLNFISFFYIYPAHLL